MIERYTYKLRRYWTFSSCSNGENSITYAFNLDFHLFGLWICIDLGRWFDFVGLEVVNITGRLTSHYDNDTDWYVEGIKTTKEHVFDYLKEIDQWR